MTENDGEWKEWSKHVLIELKRLADGQNASNDNIEVINNTLIRNTTSLEEHIRRTNLLEAAMKIVESHVQMMNGAFKLIGLVSVLSGIVIGLIKLLH